MFKKYLIIGITISALIIISIFYFFMEFPENNKISTADYSYKTGTIYSNIVDTEKILKISLVIKGQTEESVSYMYNREGKIKNTILEVISGINYKAIQSPNATKRLREKILESLNKENDMKIEEVHIIEFILS